MDEGIVERGEDAGNAEDELALTDLGTKLCGVRSAFSSIIASQ